MCIQNALQQHILDLTNQGADVIAFFYATMQGRTPNAQPHHQMDAAKQLRKLGLDPIFRKLAEEHNDDCENTVRPEPVEEHSDEGENPTHPVRPVTDLDILNYETARLIREETNDGFNIAEFLARVMNGTSPQQAAYVEKDRIISEADRLAAGRELLNRGLGRFGDSRNRRLSNSQEDRDLIQSGLSRYIREHTEYGVDAVRFLLDVASGQDAAFSMHQRVVATLELVKRGWDTNYDAITTEHIADYYERQGERELTEYDLRVREWQKAQREAYLNPPEEEPPLEAGLFSHLTDAELDRYEAMSAEEQAEFVELQRALRAANQPAAPPADQPETDIDPDETTDSADLPALTHAVSTQTPHPVHPARPESQTRIRSP